MSTGLNFCSRINYLLATLQSVSHTQSLSRRKGVIFYKDVMKDSDEEHKEMKRNKIFKRIVLL